MTTPSQRESQRLFDYFAIIGLSPDGGLDPDRLQGEEVVVPPLERSYLARVLGHYPDHAPPALPFDSHAVQMLCLPRGLQFRTQKHMLEPRFHPFLVTKEDGSRAHGFAYVFYEEVNSKQICTAMHTLQSVYLTEMSSSHAKGTSGTPTNTRDTRSLPRQFRLSSPKSPAALHFYDITKDQLYVTKCIALVGQHPYVYAGRKFLTELYRFFIQCESSAVSLESHVYNLLYEVPAPPPGRCVAFSSVGKTHICQRPTSHELPLFEYSLREFFQSLGVESVVQLLTCVLLENQVILVSSDYYKLMMVAESICTLIFPFVWQHVYVPILPSSLHHFLDAPVPFIMGLQCSHDSRDLIQIPNEANLCLVDVDEGTVEVPEDLPQFPHRADFIQELNQLLNKWEVPMGKLDRKSASQGPGAEHWTPDYQSGTMPTKLSWNLNEHHSQYKYRRRRKFSWSHDSDSGVSSTEGSISGSHSSITSVNTSSSPSPLQGLSSNKIHNFDPFHLSPQLKEITAIAKKAGVFDSEEMDRIRREGDPEMMDELKFNNAVREVFLNRFIHMFCAYDHFVIQPNCQGTDMEQWLSCRESVQNFDKATFLSDQPELHLPFLSRFIESQTFTSLVDHKILANWGKHNSNLRIFDLRIRLLRDRYDDSLVRTPSYETCTTIKETEQILEKRLANIDYRAPLPQPMDPQAESCTLFNPGHFPLLDRIALNKEPHNKKRSSHAWRRRERQERHLEHTGLSGDQRDKVIHEAKSKLQPKLADMSPAYMAQTNWKFVEQLLKECKTRTKRMLVEKMGSEAVELGHGEGSLVGVEENTLIASLCDLLERVWAHGLQSKQGKSALWSHLLNFQELEDCNDSSKPDNPNFLSPAPQKPSPKISSLSPLSEIVLSIRTGNISGLGYLASQLANNFDLSTMALETESAPASPTKSSSNTNSLRKKPLQERWPTDRSGERRSRAQDSSGVPTLRPLPISVTFDMRNVLAMTEIKTHIGYARAWVRLSLEKKVLSKHLTALLGNGKLLQDLYKRYAFLRCEDEKEQFLSYLLSLNAVDYFCFTNTYASTMVPYRVVIFPSRKLSGASTSSNAWVSLGGTHGQTSKIPVPRNQVELVFQHKNLGLLTTLRIGHDNTGMSPKWMVEHVLVRNEVTGHTWKFPCGRWLGRGIDDGSLERILVGELVPSHITSDDLVESCRTPPRCRSPNMPGPRRSDLKLTIPDIQQHLGDSVNNLVKYFYKPEKERGSLTLLLCGDFGLVCCLEQVFSYGFKSTRFFGKNLYLWDYFERAQQHFEVLLREEVEREQLTGITRDGRDHGLGSMAELVTLVSRINGSSSHLGKDDKFQLFVCLAARAHLLSRILLPLQRSPVTSHMYDESSFLRDPQLVRDLINVLSALNEFEFILESSLTRGID
ncbi:DENN domain-containing protein 5B-like isoform X2 [Eriocheir sinensis]|uniref:DENN domain-containing protein 5B-like isoform X2 n=1 Tax=Eriocheir sinensis TaxID=95602 RepID=UPI0021C98BD9|nr:DENN domain-containing protein 5B-like isoform X2 [Eriocheir sinensis]